MGQCGGKPTDTDLGKNHSKAVDKDLMKSKSVNAKVHKLLLLGTGNSGKSTFFKQLTQIHAGGFEDEMFISAAKHIQDAVVVQMKNLLLTFKHENDEFKVDFNEDCMEAAKMISNVSPEQALAGVKDHIALLWKDPIIKNAWENRTNLGVSDSAPHFFHDLERIAKADYRPTAEDILLARIPTTGIRNKKFVVKGNVFNIFDVGGQRSERSKWIHCFESVHAILFVASLSCYDQMLYEENQLNAMYEALALFDQVVNSRYFKKTSMILFLNKSDLFRVKIEKRELTVCFEDFKGANTFGDGVAFIAQKFKEKCKEMNGTPEKNIYSHVTCATDQDNVKKVFDDVQHSVVMHALRNNGLI